MPCFLMLVFLLWASAASLRATPYYVATNGPGGGATDWATAASNIQDAISLCSSGDVVWVSNGVYEAGGVTNWPAGTVLTNRVAITTAYVTVKSANNDPTNTIIKGNWNPATTNGPAAVRCVYMTNYTALIGFTLTNGATATPGESALVYDHRGGGIWCPSTVTTISNCIIVKNSAYQHGGGSLYGTFFNCTLAGNSTISGHGGGVYAGILSNCALTGNSAAADGGGTAYSTLYRCTLADNSATMFGGASKVGSAYHCTFSGNSASYGSAVGEGNLYNCLLFGNTGGGASYYGNIYSCTFVSNNVGSRGGVLHNCVLYYNAVNYDWGCTFYHSCTTPARPAWDERNTTNNPMFKNINARDYRLANNSPCVNAGTNQGWMINSVDLDGTKRVLYGTADMGAFEKFFESSIYTVY